VQEAAAVRQRAMSRMPGFVAEAVGQLGTALGEQAVPPRKADAT
jgi:hypothetical protein